MPIVYIGLTRSILYCSVLMVDNNQNNAFISNCADPDKTPPFAALLFGFAMVAHVPFMQHLS